MQYRIHNATRRNTVNTGITEEKQLKFCHTRLKNRRPSAAIYTAACTHAEAGYTEKCQAGCDTEEYASGYTAHGARRDAVHTRSGVLIRLIQLLLALLLLCPAVFSTGAISVGAISVGAVAAASGFVDDRAQVISDETEEYIRARADALSRLTGAQIVIATVRSTEGEAIDRFAERYFTNNEIGDANKDNGVLLLMATDDGDYWLTKGGGLEGGLPVSALRTMLDSILEPSFAVGEYDIGAKAMFDALYGKLCALYDVNPSPTSGSDTSISGTTDTTITEKKSRGVLPYLLLAAIAAAIIAVAVLLIRAVRSPADADDESDTDNSDDTYATRAVGGSARGSAAGRGTATASAGTTRNAAATGANAEAARNNAAASTGAVGSRTAAGTTGTVGVRARAQSNAGTVGNRPTAQTTADTAAQSAVQTPDEVQRILLARRRSAAAGTSNNIQGSAAAHSARAASGRTASAATAQGAPAAQSRKVQSQSQPQSRSQQYPQPQRTQSNIRRGEQPRNTAAPRTSRDDGPFCYHSDRSSEPRTSRRG